MSARLLPRRKADPAAPVAAPVVAVLCGHVPPFAVGTALAAGLRSGLGAAAAVVAVLPGSAGEHAPGTLLPPRAGARRLAASLGLRGTAATASGRLVLARLDEHPAAAVAEAQRVITSAGGAPVVLVLAGPRDEGHATLLAGCDHVVAVMGAAVPAALPDLARLAGADHVVGIDVPAVARELAGCGVPVLGPLRALGHQLSGGTR